MTTFVAGLPGAWFTVVLIFCAVTCWAAYGIRSLFSWQAAAALVLFFLGVAASNAWQYSPRPAEGLTDAETLEAWRLWIIYAKEAVRGAITGMWALWAGMAFLLAFQHRNRAPMLTKLILLVCFVSQVGDTVEFAVCKLNDPGLGFEHEYYASGDQRPSCGRAFGNLGPLLFPAFTAAPLPFILLTTWRKRRNHSSTA